MRAFSCPSCSQLVSFQNFSCLHCGTGIGYERGWATMRGLGDDGLGRCDNADRAACNWLVVEGELLCECCLLTRTRPAEGDPQGLAAFAAVESAKRHLVFELDELGLAVESFRERDGGLAFDLLCSEAEQVSTGHAHGVITLDLAESDDARAARMQRELSAPFRTMLGHLRHEIGHYFFPILVADHSALERFRAQFGDERGDQAAAHERHDQVGAPDGWHREHVSAYATVHPSEDWAETFAHYLHIRDMLETARAHRLTAGGADAAASLTAWPRERYPAEFAGIIDDWLPLTYALNAINRSMGRADLYPVALTQRAIAKLELVHELVAEASSG